MESSPENVALIHPEWAHRDLGPYGSALRPPGGTRDQQEPQGTQSGTQSDRHTMAGGHSMPQRPGRRGQRQVWAQHGGLCSPRGALGRGSEPAGPELGWLGWAGGGQA